MIQLIAIDMDGTLLDSQKNLPQENIAAIQEAVAAGIKIVICTGRSQAGVKPYFDQLGLTDKEFVILNNGCSLHETLTWTTLYDRALTSQELLELQAYVATNPEVDLVLTTNQDYYFVGEKPSELAQADANMVFTKLLAIKPDEIETITEPVYNAMYTGTPEAIDAFQEQYASEITSDYSGVRSQAFLYEVLPKGCHKAAGLKALAAMLDIDASQIMAIGDANNDLEMMAFSGCAVAMANASEKVKGYADWVTLSNDQAGVAHAIRNGVLKQSLPNK